MDCASLDDGVLYAAFAASPFAKLPTLTELRLIADAVAADDAFSFALACTPFCCQRGSPFAGESEPSHSDASFFLIRTLCVSVAAGFNI